jgi:hypothetical protein
MKKVEVGKQGAITLCAIPAEVPSSQTGDWKLSWENEDCKFWDNTDGRKIAQRFDEDTKTAYFVVGDQWGAVDTAKTLEEAQRIVRPAANLEDTLKLADTIAQEMAKKEDQRTDIESVLMDYLAARRIAPSRRGNGDCRAPEYDITLRVKAHKLATVEKKAKEAFGNDLRTVKKIPRNTSRAAELHLAEEHFNTCKEIVSALKGEMENWHDGIPEHFQSSEKYSEVASCLDSLESLESDLEDISFDSIEFPRMF